MRKRVAAICGFAVVGIASCGRIPSNRPVQATSAALVPAGSGQVVTDSHQGGNRILEVNLLPPVTAGFATQAIVHRWVASDVTEYDVTLDDGAQNLLTVVVLPETGQSVAVLDNLRFGVPYTVTVVAKGNDGGIPTAATQILNSQTPAVASVVFTGSNDVDNEQSIMVQVQLDSVVFDGSATVSLGASDGPYASPGQPESGYAWPVATPAPSQAPTSAPTPFATQTPAPALTPSPFPSPFMSPFMSPSPMFPSVGAT